MSLFKQILNEAKQCATQCKSDLHKAGEYARSTEGQAIRTKANQIKDNSKRDRKAFNDYMDGTISGAQYQAILAS